jgi:predicted porin
MQNGSGSRLGVRGVEDLGGGLKATFNIEHRFAADVGNTGTNNNAANAATTPMWNGRSIVGLQGGFGEVRFGREYTTNFLYVQLAADPWGYDTVAANGSLGGTVDTVRSNNSITYSSPTVGGFRGHFQWVMDETPGTDTNGSYNLALTYGAGPLSLGFGRIDRDNFADWNMLTAAYNFGAFKLIGGYGFGKYDDSVVLPPTSPVNGGDKVRDYHIAATMPVGGGEARVSYNKLENRTADTDISSKFGLGYHYAMSKRTTVYADYARDGELTDNKWGFDFGIKHNF